MNFRLVSLIVLLGMCLAWLPAQQTPAPESIMTLSRKAVDKVMKASKIKLKKFPYKTLVLVGPPTLPGKYGKLILPDIEKFEAELMDLFGTDGVKSEAGDEQNMGTVIKRKTTYLALIETSKNFNAFQRRVSSKEGKTLGFKKAGSGAVFAAGRQLSAICMDAIFDSRYKRALACHLAAAMMVSQASGGRAPDCMTAGFASDIEFRLFGHPRVLASYWPPRGGKTWARQVKSRIAGGKVTSLSRLIKAERSSLKPGQAAEIWSFNHFLLQRPEAYDRMLGQLKKGEKPLKAICTAYETDIDSIGKAWHTFASGMADGDFGEMLPKWKNFSPYAPDGWHDLVNTHIKVILQKAGLLDSLSMHRAEHVTLICSDALAKKFLPDVKALEEKLEKMFGGSIRTGLDPRSAHIILLDAATQGRLRALAYAMAPPAADQAGMAANGKWADMATKAGGWRGPLWCVSDMTRFGNDTSRKRSIAYNVGYMYMGQLTGMKIKDFMMCGFGNFCEQLMYKEPGQITISYETRDFDNKGKWSNHMRNLIRLKKTVKASDVYTFSTETMTLDEYIQCWSLSDFLASHPKQYQALVEAVADGMRTDKAIELIYKVNNDQLTALWLNAARKRR